MRKLTSLVALSLSVLFLLSPITVLASDKDDLLSAIEPYQQIVAQVNAEYDASISLDLSDLNSAYLYLTSMTLTEFKNKLIENYQAPDELNVISQTTTNMTDPRLRSVTEDITQTFYIDYGAVWLRSYVFSGSGIAGSFTYQSVIDTGYVVMPGKYFRSDSSSYSISSDKKSVTVKYTGVWVEGIIEYTAVKYYTVTYYAN